MLLLTYTQSSLYDFTASKDSYKPKFKINGRSIFVEVVNFEFSSLEHEESTSQTIWDGSLLLSKYLEIRVREGSLDLTDLNVLELGSGCGVLGLSSLYLGARRMTLTEVKTALPNLNYQIKLNQWYNQEVDFSGVEVKSLDWRIKLKDQVEDYKSYDLVLAADVIWVDSLIEPLIRTFAELLNTCKFCYIAYQIRGKSCHDLFLKNLQTHDLNYVEIQLSEELCSFGNSNLSIYQLWKSKLKQ